MRVEDGFQPVSGSASQRCSSFQLVASGQVPFTEGHPFTTDPVLPTLLKRILPQRCHYMRYFHLVSD